MGVVAGGSIDRAVSRCCSECTQNKATDALRQAQPHQSACTAAVQQVPPGDRRRADGGQREEMRGRVSGNGVHKRHRGSITECTAKDVSDGLVAQLKVPLLKLGDAAEVRD